MVIMNVCNCLSLYLFLRDHLHLLVDPGLLLLALALGLQHLQQLLDALVPGAQRLLLGVYPHLQLLGTVVLYNYSDASNEYSRIIRGAREKTFSLSRYFFLLLIESIYKWRGANRKYALYFFLFVFQLICSL